MNDSAQTEPQTEPCPICGRMEPHAHARAEWWAWEERA